MVVPTVYRNFSNKIFGNTDFPVFFSSNYLFESLSNSAFWANLEKCSYEYIIKFQNIK